MVRLKSDSGLGNVKENKMWLCQLQWIQERVDAFYPYRNGVSIPFWIDTICVPHSKALKKVAIRKMQSTCEIAGQVLVLDSSLHSMPVALRPSDTFLKIITCKWRFRLWTLQEVGRHIPCERTMIS